MSTDRQVGKKLPDWTRREDTPGIRVDSGPYIGVVKNALDPLRAGRLQVYIPSLGGDPESPQNWITVSYASPYYGSTHQPLNSKLNQYDKTEHTYGMWFVPPDVGNEVLVTFVMGKVEQGYWFACVNPGLSHYMVPGIAAAKNLNKDGIVDQDLKKSINDQGTYPAAEFNDKDPALAGSTTFLKNPRAVHEYQAKILVNQGLDRDAVRGAISSSSQREVPSAVFGISTPGRSVPDTADNYNDYANKLNDNKLQAKDFDYATRKGGHTFVMDDGDAAGNDQLIRLRTAGGHQLLMNDKERIIYIGNSEGSVWVELAGSGHIHIYSSAGLNIRTQGDFNLHADKNININAGGNINVAAKNSLAIESQTASIFAQNSLVAFASDVGIGSSGPMKLSSAGAASVKAGGNLNLVGSIINLNSGGADSVNQPSKIKVNTLSDTQQDSSTKLWVSRNGALSTIATIAPTHEPWARKGATGTAGTGTAAAGTAGSGTATTGTATGTTTANAAASSSQTTAGAVKDPCTIAKPPAGGEQTINSGPAPRYIIDSIECGANSNQPLDPGPKKAQKLPVKRPVDKRYMLQFNSFTPPKGIGPLSVEQVKAIMVQMGWSESSFNYGAREIARGNYIGKYQFGAGALTTLGYIKPDYYRSYRNRAVTITEAWRSKDQISSMQDWFNSPGVQERVMYENMVLNYKTMVQTFAIKKGDDICTVAGMICAAHLLGAAGAKAWRRDGIGSDANDTTGETYFNMGRYAVDVLARTASTASSTPTTSPPTTATAATVTPAPIPVPTQPIASSTINVNGVNRELTLAELQDMRAKIVARGPIGTTAQSRLAYKEILQSVDKAIAAAQAKSGQ